jgi:hypothetical protein
MKIEEGYTRELNAGDRLIVEGQSITIGTAVLRFGRPVTEDDVQSVVIIYAMGAAARTRLVAASWQHFLGTFDPILIDGYDDGKEEGDSETFN